MPYPTPPLLSNPDPLALYGNGGPEITSIAQAGQLPANTTHRLKAPYTTLTGTLTQDTTLTITGWTVAAQLVLAIAQDATGGHSLTIIAGKTTLYLGAPDNPTAFGVHALISPDGTNAAILSSTWTDFSTTPPS